MFAQYCFENYAVCDCLWQFFCWSLSDFESSQQQLKIYIYTHPLWTYYPSNYNIAAYISVQNRQKCNMDYSLLSLKQFMPACHWLIVDSHVIPVFKLDAGGSWSQENPPN